MSGRHSECGGYRRALADRVRSALCCHTRLAHGYQADWIQRWLLAACASLCTEMTVEDGRLVITCQPEVRFVDAETPTRDRHDATCPG